MRFLWGMVLGAALVSAAVVWSGGRPAFVFAAGAIVGAFLFARVSHIRHVHGPSAARVPVSRVAVGVACPVVPANSRPAGIAGSAEGPWPVGMIRSRQKGRGTVQSRRSMLNPLQQDVVSSLMNLGAKFRDAEAAVLAATPGNEGKSFDEFFRAALGLLKQPAAYAKRGAA